MFYLRGSRSEATVKAEVRRREPSAPFRPAPPHAYRQMPGIWYYIVLNRKYNIIVNVKHIFRAACRVGEVGSQTGLEGGRDEVV